MSARTINVELVVPVPPEDGSWLERLLGRPGELRVSTEVILDEDVAAAIKAGVGARAAIEAFIVGYGQGQA